MSVVKINAIEVPEGAGPELEARFAARADGRQSAGLRRIMLLRPTSGDDRYFVVTRWESEERVPSLAQRSSVRSPTSRDPHRRGIR